MNANAWHKLGSIKTRGARIERILRAHGVSRENLISTHLFDAHFYRERYSIPPNFTGDALDHFLTNCLKEELDPNEYFSTRFYFETYPDIKKGKHVPLLHYIKHGAAEGRDPSARFSTRWYVTSYPDVAVAGMNPLAHFLVHGIEEGRDPVKSPHSARQRLADRYRAYGDVAAATLVDMQIDNSDVTRFFSPRTPLNVFPDDRLNARPHLNMLIPSLQMRHASGGPNTAFILGMLLARAGIQLRFIATDATLESSLAPIKTHIEKLAGLHPDDFSVEFVDACDRSRSVPIGRNDIFFATAWWTAQMARSATRMLHHSRFLYLIQDYETLFYGAGENVIDAAATYEFDYFPVVNSHFLYDHLVQQRIGRFGDPVFAKQAAVFAPAISRDFFPVPSNQIQRRVLFYARPTIAARNLFGLGVAALRAAIASGVFSVGEWTFEGIGEPFEPIDLGQGHVLRPVPWLGFSEYARLMRESHVLLSLMLSPHPSYPPIEMAACGGKVVTTIYGSKTADALTALSSNIIGVEPTIEGLLTGLHRAVGKHEIGRRDANGDEGITLPRTWNAALSPVIPTILGELASLGMTKEVSRLELPEPSTVISASEEVKESPQRYIESARTRRRADARILSPPRLSVLTVLDSGEEGLNDLAHTVLGQTPAAEVDWLIVSIGPLGPFVERYLRMRPSVRCQTVSSFVEGVRWACSQAKGDYLVFTHATGKLFPDALHAMACFLLRAGLPSCAVTRGALIEVADVREFDGIDDLARALVAIRVPALASIASRDKIGGVADLARQAATTIEHVVSIDHVLYTMPAHEADSRPSAVPEPSHSRKVEDIELPEQPDNQGKRPPPSISILTPLYHRSDTDLFRQTADSVRSQTCSPHEWVVLAQGTVDPSLESLLRTYEADGLLRVARSDRNEGIAVGLRRCLELATGDLCFWLDGDDVLLPNAVALLSHGAERSPDTAIFYSDEDLLVDNVAQSPFYRPDFDPALLFSHSYVYHLILFRRTIALQLGAFTSDKTQYAQDWDILVRFVLAGHKPSHVAQVLVHWRHHTKSTSGSGTTFEGSLQSIKGVLSSIIDHEGGAAKLEVAPYPIDLGAPDFYIKRFPIDPPRIRRIDLGFESSADIDFPFASTTRVEVPTIAALAEIAREASEDFVMLCNTALFGIDPLGLWQAVKHFDLLQTCVAVGGPITDAIDNVVHGGPVRIAKFRLVDIQLGHPVSRPGPFSLALKPHCVDVLAMDFLVVRSLFLREALDACPRNLALGNFGAWLGAFAGTRNQHLVYEPLLVARCHDPDRLLSDSAEGMNVALRYPIADALGDDAWPFVLRGMAGFARAEAKQCEDAA